MDSSPLNFDICPQCGVEFGYDDFNTPHDVLRERWIGAGRPLWEDRVKDAAWKEWYEDQLHPDPLASLRADAPAMRARAEAVLARRVSKDLDGTTAHQLTRDVITLLEALRCGG